MPQYILYRCVFQAVAPLKLGFKRIWVDIFEKERQKKNIVPPEPEWAYTARFQALTGGMMINALLFQLCARLFHKALFVDNSALMGAAAD